MPRGIGRGSRDARERQREQEEQSSKHSPLSGWPHRPKDAEIVPGTIRASNRQGA
jgi:hypothetical protein